MTTRPGTIRLPAVAGRFYPDGEAALRTELHSLLLTAGSLPDTPRALVVPHAGYIFSGPIAAEAYATLRGNKSIRRVAVLGPSHRVALHGMAIPTAEAFDTPLGRIALDREALQALGELPQVGVSDEAHALEHSIEVQLPFLQQVLGDFTLVPVVVGDASATDVARVINALWRDDTLIVISTDLSHYHDYLTARRMDAHTIERILERESDLNGNEACGCRPLNGLLQLLKDKDMEIELLKTCNSGDALGNTAGARDQVVGYASFSVH